MSYAAVEEHIEFDERVESRVTYHFTLRCRSLVAEHENVGPKDVDIRASEHVIYLCFDSLGDTYVIWVHPRYEVCIHIKGYLDASVERLRHPSILLQGIN